MSKLALGLRRPPLSLTSNPTLKQPLSHRRPTDRPASERETRSTAAGRAPVASISTAEALADQEEDEEAEDEEEAAKEEDKWVHDADEGEAQEKEAEAEAMDEEVTEDEARDADAKHSD